MVRSVPLWGLVCFRIVIASAASGQTAGSGARDAGLARATVAAEMEVFATANPAALSAPSSVAVGFSVSRPYGISELDLLSAGLAARLRSSRAAVTAERFGFSLFRSDRLGLTVARSIGPADNRSATFGCRLTAERAAIEGQSPTAGVAFSAGWLLRLPGGNALGASAQHLIQRRGVSHPHFEKVMAVGFRGLLSAQWSILAQLEKSERHSPAFRAGLEWQPVETLALRLGVGSAPSLLAFGLGARVGSIRADLASARHPWLGWSPAVSALIERTR